jgi:exodeoxyribonuclease VII small subunit
MPKTAQPTFEQAMQELTVIVNGLEQQTGQLNLDSALKQFERGVELTRFCQKALSDAEQKVQLLSSLDHTASLTDFNSDDENDD